MMHCRRYVRTYLVFFLLVGFSALLHAEPTIKSTMYIEFGSQNRAVTSEGKLDFDPVVRPVARGEVSVDLFKQESTSTDRVTTTYLSGLACLPSNNEVLTRCETEESVSKVYRPTYAAKWEANSGLGATDTSWEGSVSLVFSFGGDEFETLDIDDIPSSIALSATAGALASQNIERSRYVSDQMARNYEARLGNSKAINRHRLNEIKRISRLSDKNDLKTAVSIGAALTALESQRADIRSIPHINWQHNVKNGYYSHVVHKSNAQSLDDVEKHVYSKVSGRKFATLVKDLEEFHQLRLQENLPVSARLSSYVSDSGVIKAQAFSSNSGLFDNYTEPSGISNFHGQLARKVVNEYQTFWIHSDSTKFVTSQQRASYFIGAAHVSLGIDFLSQNDANAAIHLAYGAALLDFSKGFARGIGNHLNSMIEFFPWAKDKINGLALEYRDDPARLVSDSYDVLFNSPFVKDVVHNVYTSISDDLETLYSGDAIAKGEVLGEITTDIIVSIATAGAGKTLGVANKIGRSTSNISTASASFSKIPLGVRKSIKDPIILKGGSSNTFKLGDKVSVSISSSSTLLGKSPNRFRSEALRIINETSNHPLKFLVGDSGKFHKKFSPNMTHSQLSMFPEIIEMGHIRSKKLSGHPEYREELALEIAALNRYNATSIERRGLGAGIWDRSVLDIGGVAVDGQSAAIWADLGLIDQRIFDNSKKLDFED